MNVFHLPTGIHSKRRFFLKYKIFMAVFLVIYFAQNSRVVQQSIVTRPIETYDVLFNPEKGVHLFELFLR